MATVNNSQLDGTDSNFSPTMRYALVAVSAMTWYNAIEMILLVLVVFKKYRGLYFWSMTIASINLIPYQVGAFLKLVYYSYNVPATILLNTGWIVMIVGQSVVLYSRLHLVTQNAALLKFVRYMIATTGIVLCTSTAVTTYGSNFAKTPAFVSAYNVVEKTQMTTFSVQEFFISLIYLWRVRALLKLASHQRMRRILYELVVINVVIICLDIMLLGMEYRNAYQVEIVVKGLTYSIKLKLELGVLSKLVRTVSGREFQTGVLARVGENFPLEGDRFHLGWLATNMKDTMRRKSSSNGDWLGSQAERDRKGSNAVVSPRVAAACADISGRRPSAAAHTGTRMLIATAHARSDEINAYESIDRVANIPEHSSVDPEGPSAVMLQGDTQSMMPLYGSRQTSVGGSGYEVVEYPGRLLT